jgi:hypothetical protein
MRRVTVPPPNCTPQAGIALPASFLICFSLGVVLLSSATDVVTYHNDIARTGQNQRETILNYNNLEPSRFGKSREAITLLTRS